MCGQYFLDGSNLEKCGKFWKKGRFSGRIWPDWGNTAWADWGLKGYRKNCCSLSGPCAKGQGVLVEKIC